MTIPLAMLVAIIFYFLIMPHYGYSEAELAEMARVGFGNVTCY